MQFADLRLVEPILRAVRTAGYDQPTPIQAKAIPQILAGRDVLGCAQTGTGKTAAFALPILQRLATPEQRAGGPRRIRTLVLCPTRELAAQIQDSFATYGAHLPLRSTVIFGGVNQNSQVRALRAGVDILIATPGRLRDLMGQKLVSLAGVEILVLDEADRMLDMGFLPDIRRIVDAVPARRQTLLFSATMPEPIRRLTDDILREPVAVEVTPVSSAAPSVEHWVYHVEKGEKMSLLTRLLADTPHTRALVFTRTKHGADRVVRSLAKSGVAAAALHGNKSQNARTRALDDFRTARTPVLVATDIAARGLDVDDISHVFNYDLTADPETYVHRIGRTGRAGATGTAVSFCASEERSNLADIERLLRTTIKRLGDGPRSVASPRSEAAPTPSRQDARSQNGRSDRGRAQTSRREARGQDARAGDARQQDGRAQDRQSQDRQSQGDKPRRQRRRRRNAGAPAGATASPQTATAAPAHLPEERRSMRSHRALSRRGRAMQPATAR